MARGKGVLSESSLNTPKWSYELLPKCDIVHGKFILVLLRKVKEAYTFLVSDKTGPVKRDNKPYKLPLKWTKWFTWQSFYEFTERNVCWLVEKKVWELEPYRLGTGHWYTFTYKVTDNLHGRPAGSERQPALVPTLYHTHLLAFI